MRRLLILNIIISQNGPTRSTSTFGLEHLLFKLRYATLMLCLCGVEWILVKLSKSDSGREKLTTASALLEFTDNRP
jgi:hypothetical protein